MNIQDHLLSGDNCSFIKSPNTGGIITPNYLIIHYTAGTTLEGAVNWFKTKESSASAHLVIDRDGTVVQMVKFNQKAWHAGNSKWGELKSMNQHSIGIELVNSGRLKFDINKGWVNWAKNFIIDDEIELARYKNEPGLTAWHKYTDTQIDTLTQIAHLLNAKYNFKDILGHDEISPGRKTDPGPLFPMSNFKKTILG